MKCTRWALGLLGVAGLILSVTADANAWLFHGCCGHHCNMHITCRQYNAFTPFCSGTVHCDGCCPNFGCAPMNMGIPGCSSCGMGGPIASAWAGTPIGMPMAGFPMGGMPMAGYPMGGFPVAWGDPHAGTPMQSPTMLPPGTSIPTGLPMVPPMGLPPGAPLPPGPPNPAPGSVPPILNHTAQGTAPAYYYGVQPASYYGYYGYNPYAYWAALANPYYGYGYGQQPR